MEDRAIEKHDIHNSALSTTRDVSHGVEAALMHGDIAKLSAKERVDFYLALCNSLRLNPLTRPFTFIKDDGGKLQPYASKECVEQLRKMYKVSTRILSREWQDDLYIITVEASTPDGRMEESQGIVCITSQGQKRANEMMKAETKAKRRVTLSLLGLGLSHDDDALGVAFDPRTGELQGDDPEETPALSERDTLLAEIKAWLVAMPHSERDQASRQVFGVIMSNIPTLPNSVLYEGINTIRVSQGHASDPIPQRDVEAELFGDDIRHQEPKPLGSFMATDDDDILEEDG